MAHNSQRYGLVDGNLVAALEMRGRINRPPMMCPFCKEVCDWVAGPIVTPHIRHKSESECSAEGWAESNAHLNGKMRIIEVLRKQHRIDLLVKCLPHSTSSYQWALPPWAFARDEVRTPSGRVLDVALIDNRGEVVAAIEVFHSHRVDAAKAESLAQDGIPWIEVTAEVANAWVGQPFACEAMHPRVGCQACEAWARAFAAVPCIVKVCPCGARTPDIWTGVDQTDGTVHIDGARITYGSGDRVACIDIDPETPDQRWLAVTWHAIAQDFADRVPVHGLCSYCVR